MEGCSEPIGQRDSAIVAMVGTIVTLAFVVAGAIELASLENPDGPRDAMLGLLVLLGVIAVLLCVRALRIAVLLCEGAVIVRNPLRTISLRYEDLDRCEMRGDWSGKLGGVLITRSGDVVRVHALRARVGWLRSDDAAAQARVDRVNAAITRGGP